MPLIGAELNAPSVADENNNAGFKPCLVNKAGVGDMDSAPR